MWPLTSKNSNRLIFVLSILGALIAAYVTQSFIRQTPIVCVNTGCELVRKNPASYLFGVPIPAFGLIGYSLLAVLAFLRTTSEALKKKLLPFIVAIATGGVVFVGWFTYMEIVIIKAVCTWCVISAVNMTVICMLSLVSMQGEKKNA